MAATLKQQQMYAMQPGAFSTYDQYYSNMPYGYGVNQQMMMNQQYNAYSHNEFKQTANPSKVFSNLFFLNKPYF